MVLIGFWAGHDINNSHFGIVFEALTALTVVNGIFVCDQKVKFFTVLYLIHKDVAV